MTQSSTIPDLELLGRFAQDKDQSAFTELIARHIDWVHSAAVRQTRDAHLAEDVTQAVFLALSQQAKKLSRGVVVHSWLFQVTRRAAAMAVRGEVRRKRREREAAMLSEIDRDLNENDWESLAPMLDELVEKLGEADRQTILLRFYQRKSFAEIGALLSIDESAARKRASRAIERLRQLFRASNVSVASTVFTVALLRFTTTAAPAQCAAGVETLIAAPHTAPVRILVLSKGALKMMSWNKMALVFGLLAFGVMAISLAVAQSTRNPQQPKPRDGVAATRPATVPANKPGEMGPKAVIAAAYRAGLAGDEDVMVKVFTKLTPAQETTVRQIAQVMAATEQLRKTVEVKFGERAAQQFGALGTNVAALDVSKAVETVAGDLATVNMGSAGPGVIDLEKVGGVWKVSSSVFDTLDAAGVDQWARKIPLIQNLATDIADGKIKSMQELAAEARKVLQ